MSTTTLSSCAEEECYPYGCVVNNSHGRMVPIATPGPFYKTMGQPLVYFAQCKPYEDKSSRTSSARRSKKENKNCFVKAFKWYTQERPCDTRNETSHPQLSGFAKWLDIKYGEYLRDNESEQQQQQQHLTGQSCGYRSGLSRSWKKRFSTKKTADDTICKPCGKTESCEFILQPKDVTRPASLMVHPNIVPCPNKSCTLISSNVETKKSVVKSQSLTIIKVEKNTQNNDDIRTEQNGPINKGLELSLPPCDQTSKQKQMLPKPPINTEACDQSCMKIPNDQIGTSQQKSIKPQLVPCDQTFVEATYEQRSTIKVQNENMNEMPANLLPIDQSKPIKLQQIEAPCKQTLLPDFTENSQEMSTHLHSYNRNCICRQKTAEPQEIEADKNTLRTFKPIKGKTPQMSMKNYVECECICTNYIEPKKDRESQEKEQKTLKNIICECKDIIKNNAFTLKSQGDISCDQCCATEQEMQKSQTIQKTCSSSNFAETRSTSQGKPIFCEFKKITEKQQVSLNSKSVETNKKQGKRQKPVKSQKHQVICECTNWDEIRQLSVNSQKQQAICECQNMEEIRQVSVNSQRTEISRDPSYVLDEEHRVFVQRRCRPVSLSSDCKPLVESQGTVTAKLCDLDLRSKYRFETKPTRTSSSTLKVERKSLSFPEKNIMPKNSQQVQCECWPQTSASSRSPDPLCHCIILAEGPYAIPYQGQSNSSPRNKQISSSSVKPNRISNPPYLSIKSQRPHVTVDACCQCPEKNTILYDTPCQYDRNDVSVRREMEYPYPKVIMNMSRCLCNVNRTETQTATNVVTVKEMKQSVTVFRSNAAQTSDHSIRLGKEPNDQDYALFMKIICADKLMDSCLCEY